MNRTLSTVLVCLMQVLIRAETVNFDNLKTGELPSGWLASITGKGEPKWQVVADESAPSRPNALKQSGEAPKASFPVFWNKGVSLLDGWVEVKFKPVSGKIDQAGGVLWRAKDSDNYYICRANALEDNVVLYKVEGGKRKALGIVGRSDGYGVTAKVAPGQWHTIRVDFTGSRFKVVFDDKPLFEVEDGTLTGAGMIGVWTKADSVTLFDDFALGNK